MSFSARYVFAVLFVTLTVFLCGPLRISAVSALKANLNAEKQQGAWRHSLRTSHDKRQRCAGSRCRFAQE